MIYILCQGIVFTILAVTSVLGVNPVCILGAGPSGLAAALALKDKGIESIIFEKEDRVGGKCKEFVKDGVKYDMGAILLADSYYRVKSLIKKYNLPTINSKAGTRDTELFDLDGFTFSNPPSNLLDDPTMVANITVFLRHVASYLDLEYEVGFRGDSSKDPSLSIPFGLWLQQRDLLPLAQVFSFYFTGFGYGSIMDTPALYALKYSHVKNFLSFIGILGMETLTNGYQDLMENIVKNEELNVKLSVQVSKIVPKDSWLSLQYNAIDKNKNKCTEEKLKCSKVIIAFPQLASAIQPFMPLDADEKAVFEKVKTRFYYTLAFRLKNTQVTSIWFPPNSIFFNGLTMVNGVPTPSEPNTDQFPMIINRQNDEHDVLTAYVLSPTAADVNVLTQNLIETVTKLLGFQGLISEVDILKVESWENYFPHFEKADIDAGAHLNLEALQGKKGIFYTGGLLNFETVESAMEYSYDLVARFF